MKKNSIKWLHLSDLHSGKDLYAQKIIYENILKLIDHKGTPDFVFITGDIANTGKNNEYKKLGEDFLLDLKILIGDNEIFIIPGNHDIDRSACRFTSRSILREKAKRMFDPTEEGKDERSEIIPRFRNFIDDESIQEFACDVSWLDGVKGYGLYTKLIDTYKISVISINTAWLSEDRNDKGNLIFGKSIISDALDACDGSDICIVLGHHPVDWLHDDEKKKILTLFGRSGVIYLCGHKHENDSENYDGAGNSFLTLQCGVVFDERDSKIWKNGLMWVDCDLQGKVLEVVPMLWNEKFFEWSIDGQAFSERYRVSGGDKWKFNIPKKDLVSARKQEKKDDIYGWDVIDKSYILALNVKPDENEIINFFNGRIPNWKLALSKDIPRREVVDKVVSDILSSSGLSIHMLLGAGGEGKTTAFFQIIEQITKESEKFRVLYHRIDSASISKKSILSLSNDYNWIIATDDADLIAKELHEIALDLKSKKIDNVHFLLSARHSDWRNSGVSITRWRLFEEYKENELRGLTKQDASLIIHAWGKYKEKGLGKLNGCSEDDAIIKLFNASKSEVSVNEGAFLGALLRMRFGEEFKAYVRKLLDRLYEMKSSEDEPSLFYAFTCIAAMHSENMLFLSKKVLSSALKVKEGELRSKVLYPLGEEAAADIAGEMVFTRHRAIAEAAIEILLSDYRVDVDEVYIDLVRAAEELYVSGDYVVNLEGWRYNLSEYFYKKGNHSLSIKILQELLKVSNNDSFVRVRLSKMFRLVGFPDLALKVFRDSPIVDNDRVFFTEWAIAERDSHNHALALYLFVLAMSDNAALKPPSYADGVICLKGFCEESSELYALYNNIVFAKGAYYMACSILNNPKVVHWQDIDVFKKIKKHLAFVVKDETKYHYIEFYREAAILSEKYIEAMLPDWVIPVSEFNYEHLENLFKVHN